MLEEKIKVKVVLGGQKAVGKTSILNIISTGTFTYDVKPTIGCQKISKVTEYNGKMIELDLCDTAGQDKYRDIVPFFFNDCNFCILVFDLSDSSTLYDLRGWIDIFQNKAPEYAQIVLVGNKTDLKRDTSLSNERIEEFKQEYSQIIKIYFETSALKNEGIYEVERFLVENSENCNGKRQKVFDLEPTSTDSVFLGSYKNCC